MIEKEKIEKTKMLSCTRKKIPQLRRFWSFQKLLINFEADSSSYYNSHRSYLIVQLANRVNLI